MAKSRFFQIGILLLLPLVLTTCFQEQPKKKTPIHIIPDMDLQPKYKAQGSSEFFKDGSAMRQPVFGTVPRGHLDTNTRFATGKNEDGSFVRRNPRAVNMDLLKRGQERFNIYCSPCHSKAGDGRGIMVQYNYLPPASFHDDRLLNVPDGHIFDVITNGKRNMPGYAHQIPVEDRWAIIAYVRALQRSQHAPLSDVPREKRDQMR